MEYKHIKFEIKKHVMTITLNRPEKLNAFTDFVMGPELLDAFERADDDDDVRAVIVTGAGRGFCSGHDLNDGFDYNEQTEDSILFSHQGFGWGCDTVRKIKVSYHKL